VNDNVWGLADNGAAVGVEVGVAVGAGVAVGVAVGAGVRVGTGVGVDVGDGVGVAVAVGVGVGVGVLDVVGVAVGTAVADAVGVGARGVGVGVAVGDAGVGVDWRGSTTVEPPLQALRKAVASARCASAGTALERSTSHLAIGKAGKSTAFEHDKTSPRVIGPCERPFLKATVSCEGRAWGATLLYRAV
jgi:hypothetical protein